VRQMRADGADASFSMGKHVIHKRFTPHLPYNSDLKQEAKALRKAGVLSEILFWQQVHRKQFYGIDVDRQRIIGNYIVDFYIKSLSLVIEVDGSSHGCKGAYDEVRQAYLESLGLVVYRIQDTDIKRDLQGVMLDLVDFIIHHFAK